jgi:hypothetical protein
MVADGQTHDTETRALVHDPGNDLTLIARGPANSTQGAARAPQPPQPNGPIGPAADEPAMTPVLRPGEFGAAALAEIRDQQARALVYELANDLTPIACCAEYLRDTVDDDSRTLVDAISSAIDLAGAKMAQLQALLRVENRAEGGKTRSPDRAN